MTQRAKLELPINEPMTVELLFDEPINGTSRYGEYNMYAVNVDGTEYTYFPTDEVHEKLKQLHKGDKAVITKLAAQRGKKLVTTYDVQFKSEQLVPASTESRSIENTQPNKMERKDDYYKVMLQCYEDALNIQRELNGLADPEKIAVTLFIARTKNN